MKFFTAQQIRQTWIRFFQEKGHLAEPSSSLIPKDDPTLLWVNAGVAPLKKYFDGSDIPPQKRLVNVQKCIRTNDIDNVGRTARHHTFFEMMGNFSIGDYFKLEAIEFAFELLTSEKYFGMPKDKLYMTFYPDDMLTKEKWLKLGVKEDHLIPLEGNFWEIGPGPCGPDTEIFFDRGESFDSRGVELLHQDINNDRYIEIWNVVFSQYNAKEGLDRSDYPELPQRNIDTGAGLERFASVLQGTKTNFETDLFYPIIQAIESLSGITYEGQMPFKVIADHVKALTFSISDGAMLSNEGRGYVLRRLLRRAVKYGLKLNFKAPFLYKLVPTVIEMMSNFYEDIKNNQDIVIKVILKEETKFFETISDGEKLLEEALANTSNQLHAEIAFKLYDTYGFPFELTEEYALEKGIQVDKEGFKRLLQEQKERSRNAIKHSHSMQEQDETFLAFNEPSTFIGYDSLQTKARIIKVFSSGIVLDQTPFYATSGGQLADKGMIAGVEVEDVVKLPNKQHLHILDVNSFEEGQEVLCEVYETNRRQVEKNHSAAHLFHQALKESLGKHAQQQGQQVSEQSMRFDFNHFESIDEQLILELENKVNQYITHNPLHVNIYETTIDKAKEKGAMALFGEKYGDIVRVVDMGWSIELCGGTHIKNTKEIEFFAITNISSIGSGIFRAEALTGKDLKERMKPYISTYINEIENLMVKSKQNGYDVTFKYPEITGSYKDIVSYREAIAILKQHIKEEEKKKQDALEKDVLSLVNLDAYAMHQKVYKIITKDVPAKALKTLTDQIFDYFKAETVLLINIETEKIAYLCKSNTLNASDIIKDIASKTGGSGGGKPTFAQGGSLRNDHIEAIIESIQL